MEIYLFIEALQSVLMKGDSIATTWTSSIIKDP